MKLKRLVAAALAALLLATLPACSSGSDMIVQYDITARPGSFDPQLATGAESLMVLENVFEGLLRLTPDGAVIPGAAKSWDVSEDGLTYTFHLREGMVWADGETPLTAEDYAFAFQRVVNPDTASPAAAGFLCIQNAAEILDGLMAPEQLAARALDDVTLEVLLTAPNPFFPQLMASTAAFPCNKAFFTEQRGRYGYSREYLLSNGPFTIRREVQDKRLELRRNGRYVSDVPTQAAGVNLHYQVDDKPDADEPNKVLQTAAEKVRTRFLEGKTHAAPATPAQAESYLAALPGAGATSFQNRVWGLAFNGSTAYSNTKLRQAFALVLDVQAFAPYLTGSLQPADAIIPSASSLQGLPYRETVGGSLLPARDIARAKALYAEAMALLSLEKAPRTSILCPDTGDIPVMLGAYQKALQQAFGIYVNLEPLPESELLARVAAGDYTIALLPLTAERGTPDALLELFASYSPRNVCAYNSAVYDALLARAQESISPPDAAALYFSAERMLVDEAVFLPVAFETTYYVSSPEVTGLEFSPFSYQVFFQHAKAAK